jgi:FkbM family methyltransferase
VGRSLIARARRAGHPAPQVGRRGNRNRRHRNDRQAHGGRLAHVLIARGGMRQLDRDGEKHRHEHQREAPARAVKQSAEAERHHHYPTSCRQLVGRPQYDPSVSGVDPFSTRPTGTRTDHLRRLWRRLLGRFGALDRLAHRAYFHWQRLRHGLELTPDVLAYWRVESRWAKSQPVPVRVRPLGGATIWLRPGTTDPIMLRDTFRDGVHPPPPEIVARGVSSIVDLGANAGVTVAHNALLHPDATIVAVELDPGNAAAARRNTAPWSDRVQIIQGAVWESDGEVPYDAETGEEYGFRAGAGGAMTRALSMDTILAHVPEGERVDYVKMDIEGVEARLLSGEAARWAERVDSISLQVHDPYTLADCDRDLTALGFDAHVDPRRMNYIVGVRR